MAALPGKKIPIPVPYNFGWTSWQLTAAGYALIVDEIAARRAKSISSALGGADVTVFLRGLDTNTGKIKIGTTYITIKFNDGTYHPIKIETDDNRIKSAIATAFGEGVTPAEFEAVKETVKSNGLPAGVNLDLAVLGTAQKGGYRRHRKSSRKHRSRRNRKSRRRA